MLRWYERAVCAGSDHDFHSEDEFDLIISKDMCSSCPVRRECLDEALRNEDVFGVWGGVDATQLRKAQGVDHTGKPRERVRPPVCLWCGGGDIEEGPPQRTRKQMSCEDCGFVWYARVPTKIVEMQVADGRSLSSEEVGRTVLPGDEESGLWDS